MATNNNIVQKLWSLCHVLRDDGITCHQYGTEQTCPFLEMAKETGREEQLPRGYRWAQLESKDGIELLNFYRQLPLHLGTEASKRVQDIFANAATSRPHPPARTAWNRGGQTRGVGGVAGGALGLGGRGTSP